MNTETDTPRTDEWLAEEKRNPRLSGLGNWLDYCKLLERELNAVTEQRDRLAEAIITHRAKAFPLNGEDYDLELWETITAVEGRSHE